MIVGKLWRAFRAQLNKLANYFWTQDPVAQMQYEYDKAVEELKVGREGLEQYRALVEQIEVSARASYVQPTLSFSQETRAATTTLLKSWPPSS